MVKEVHVQGIQAYKEEVAKYVGKIVFAMFCGDKDEKGESWCPDCVVAEPVVAKGLKAASEDAILIHCSVGPLPYWKDQGNDFRTDADLRLKSVPTLIKVGTPRRLEEAQCADDGLVQMFFEED